MSNRLPRVLVVTLVCGIAAVAALAQRSTDPVTAEIAPSLDMAEAGRRFLSALTPAQRARAVCPVDGGERLRWHYVPMARPGLALEELDDAQRALAYGMFATALGRRGFVDASGIMALEEVLRRRERILTGPGPKLVPLPGLAADRMTRAQRLVLDALLDEVTGDLPRELADRERARIATHSAADLVFTWAGGGAPGQPHYDRISGPSFIYELDNTQAGASHVHSVWHARAPAGGDFGVDLLRQHYATAHAAPDSPHGKEVRTGWGRPIEPFRIAGNIYYVGAANIASYLIASSHGLILLDTGTREMLPRVQASIVKLGFRLSDVKILLTSHAHWDHVEGHAAMQRATGAQVMAMAEEAPAISSGKDLSAVGDIGWEPVRVDRVLHDGEDVVLGDVTMHALLTAGHTQGCTTWTTTATDHGRTYSVVFVCVPAAAAGVKLFGNPRYPTMADDLARSLRVLKGLSPDIYLDGHPEEIFAGKLARLRAGELPNPLVDRAGYARYLAECEADLQRRLREERGR
ncbi:MAG TPA: subclass B3 metallo-beta-lactamase [Kofleriaceae bacterium]|nr:subclass B3 metallo-beta-lactamase [Kofleriaceae bacterium]